MSEDFGPGHFLDEPQDPDSYDDGFNDLFEDDEPLSNPEADSPTDQHLNDTKSQTGRSDSELPQSDQGVTTGDRDDVSVRSKTSPVDDSPRNGEHGVSHAQGDHETQHISDDIVTQQREVPSLPESGSQNTSGNHGQQQVGPSSENLLYQSESINVVQGQDSLALLQSINPADFLIADNLPRLDHNDSGVGSLQSINQPADGLDEGELVPEIDWDALTLPEWASLGEGTADRKLEDILGSDFPPTTSNQRGTAVPNPGPSDVQEEWNDFGEQAADLELGEIPGNDFIPEASNTLGAAVQHPGPSDVQEAPTVMAPAVNTPTAAGHQAVGDQNSDDSDEESEDGNTPDQPDFETFKEDDPMIQCHPEQNGWGRTGTRNGQDVWFNRRTSLWQPSVPHHDVRAILIARAQAEYPNDRYLHPDPTDGLPHGETAFFKPHQNRGPARHQCADELFAWREYKPKTDEQGKHIRRAKPLFSIHDHPGYMYEGDRILLDPHNNPVVNHKHIPLTLSAYTDGGKLQEMALVPGCRQIDLWARMPRWEKKTDKNGNSQIISLRDKNTRVNMPMTRFRERKGTLAGGDREGTEVIMDGLTRFYHHHGFDPVAAGNSVKAFPRDLTPWEVKEVRLGNTARFGGRAGNRALDDATREENLQKTLKAIENGKKKQAAKDGNGSRKRGHEDDSDSSQGSGPRTQKRRRRGQEVDPGFAPLGEGYAHHQEAPNVQGSRNGMGLQQSFRGQQGGYPQPPRPSQVRVNPYGAAQSPYHTRNFHTQPSPTQNPAHFNQGYAATGGSSYPVQNRIPQIPYGGVPMQATRSPYETAQTRAALNGTTGNAIFYPDAQYPRNLLGTGRYPAIRPVEPRQGGQGDNYHGFRGVDPRSTAQSSPMSQIRPLNHPRGPVSSNPYSQPVQQEQRHEANAAPSRTGNTLGPGGRGWHQAPQQVLGKRGHQDVSGLNVNQTQSYGTQHQPINIEAIPDSTFSAPSKRRRTNGDREPVAPQHHQRRLQRPQRTARPQHYGAAGAPTPSLPQTDFFGNMQPTPTYNENVAARLMSPDEISRGLGGVFGAPSPLPNLNRRTSHLMDDAPTRHAEYIQGAPQGYESQQVPGNHRREEPVGQMGEAMYMPQQNLGQQGRGRFHGAPLQDSYISAPERRGMPGTGGYPAPPVQATRSQFVNSTRNAEPSPQIYNHQPTQNFHQRRQGESANLVPPQHPYINGPPMYVDESPRNARVQGQPLAPIPPQARQRTRSDTRDVRPVTAEESQSLDTALSFTRQVFTEWTGQQAPVTNLEDSYNVQYREIRAAFRNWWRSGNNPQQGSQVPDLWRMPAWRGAIGNWGLGGQ